MLNEKHKKNKANYDCHIYGLTVNLDPILKVAKNHKIKVLEDAAEVIGQEYKGRKCGSLVI